MIRADVRRPPKKEAGRPDWSGRPARVIRLGATYQLPPERAGFVFEKQSLQ